MSQWSRRSRRGQPPPPCPGSQTRNHSLQASPSGPFALGPWRCAAIHPPPGQLLTACPRPPAPKGRKVTRLQPVPHRGTAPARRKPLRQNNDGAGRSAPPSVWSPATVWMLPVASAASGAHTGHQRIPLQPETVCPKHHGQGPCFNRRLPQTCPGSRRSLGSGKRMGPLPAAKLAAGPELKERPHDQGT